MLATLDEAVIQIRSGRPVILLDSEDREGEGDFALAAKHCTPALVNFLLLRGRGLLCVSLPPDTADRLCIKRLENNGNGPSSDTPFGVPVDLDDGSSGIAASARSATIRALGDEAKTGQDFIRPGHVATLLANPQGLKGRIGHTEAVLDLLKMAGVQGPGVLCEILREDGEVARRDEILRVGGEEEIPILHIDALLDHLEVNPGRRAM